MYLLGYDLGTSSIKAALLNAQTGEVLAQVQSPTEELAVASPHAQWAEQDPALWWDHAQLATQLLFEQHAAAKQHIQGIGIAYQMHGLVIVDQQGQSLRPAIIWSDSRATEIGQHAATALGSDYLFSHVLNAPGNFTATKLRWVQQNEPDVFAQVHKLMLPGDYLAFKLTGEMTTTVSGLSEGTLWDFEAHSPAQQLLDQYEIPSHLIPKLVPTFGEQGTLQESAAALLDLPAGIPISYRAGDQPNNALTLGVLAPGEVAATGGTSGVVYGITDQLVGDPKQRVNSFAHVNHSQEAPRIGVLLCINGTGSMYAWLRSQVADISYPEMEAKASTVAPGSEGLLVLPFGNGAERMLNQQPIGANILGLDFRRHQQAHLIRATLEGIAFAFAYGMEQMQALGLDLNQMKVGNDNLFQSRIFSETLAQLTQSQIEVFASTGAIGAAQAAGEAIYGKGFLKHIQEKMDQVNSYKPEGQLDARLSASFEAWKSALNKLLA